MNRLNRRSFLRLLGIAPVAGLGCLSAKEPEKVAVNRPESASASDLQPFKVYERGQYTFPAGQDAVDVSTVLAKVISAQGNGVFLVTAVVSFDKLVDGKARFKRLPGDMLRFALVFNYSMLGYIDAQTPPPAPLSPGDMGKVVRVWRADDPLWRKWGGK